MKNFKSIFFVMFSMISTVAYSANIVEKEGAYEINWSSGKIRFYGVGKMSDKEDTLRSAEQRAWADGLRLAEKNIPVLMTNRMGNKSGVRADKLSKLAQSTTSVSTTYFGDQRVKVVLEAPIGQIVPQLVGEQASKPSDSAVSHVLFKVGSAAKPTAWLRVIDENGRDLFTAPAPRWFKGGTTPGEAGLAADTSTVSARVKTPGILQVSAADWRPGFGAAIMAGKAAVVVQ